MFDIYQDRRNIFIRVYIRKMETKKREYEMEIVIALLAKKLRQNTVEQNNMFFLCVQKNKAPSQNQCVHKKDITTLNLYATVSCYAFNV